MTGWNSGFTGLIHLVVAGWLLFLTCWQQMLLPEGWGNASHYMSDEIMKLCVCFSSRVKEAFSFNSETSMGRRDLRPGRQLARLSSIPQGLRANIHWTAPLPGEVLKSFNGFALDAQTYLKAWKQGQHLCTSEAPNCIWSTRAVVCGPVQHTTRPVGQYLLDRPSPW